MTTLTKLIVSTIFALLLFSCEFNGNWTTGIKGNGNVRTQERILNNEFNEIYASRGLDVYLTQGNFNRVIVEADDNLHELIIVEVINNVLEITTEENISSASSKKVLVQFKNVDKILASSGSDVFSTNTISADNLELETNSGSDMKLDIHVNSLICSSTSGSDLKLKGKSANLQADANSGSDIDASELLTEKSNVHASSGSDIAVNTSKKLIAKANSGGEVTYYGNPQQVDASEGVSGGILKR